MSAFLRRCLATLGCVAFLITALQGVPAGAQSTGDIKVADGRPDATTGAGVPCDFNGDGTGDVAAGVPGETVRDVGGAGAVVVLVLDRRRPAAHRAHFGFGHRTGRGRALRELAHLRRLQR
jgi:hypothetical protein